MPRRPRGISKTHPSRILAALHAKEALTLRMQGLTFDKIARQTGYWADGSGAYLATKTALARIPFEEAAAYRLLNIQRLNSAREGYWPQIIKGNLRAVDREIAVQGREANYLGLDQQTSASLGSQPINIQVNVVYEKASEPTP